MKVYNDHNAQIFLVLLFAVVLLPIGLVEANSLTLDVEWSKTYGPYIGYSVIQTSDGGFAIAGQNATLLMHGYNYYKPLLIKTDPSGQLQWQTEVLIAGYAVSVVQTHDSGYAIGCQPTGSFVKISAQGDIEWTKDFGLKRCQVIQDVDGNYLLAGYQENSNNGENGVFLKTDRNGNLVWSKTFSDPSVQWIELNAVIQTNNDNYLAVGSYNSSSWIIKLDSNGTLLFNNTYSLSSFDNSFSSIAETLDGSYILGGFDKNGAILTKINPEYALEWSHSYFAEGTASSVLQTSDGGYIAAGDTRIIKTDAAGNLKWNITATDYSPWGISGTSDGGYIATGVYSSGGATQEIWLGKFTSESSNNTIQSPTPTPTTSPDNWRSFQILIVVAVGATIAAAGLLVYLKKRKHP
jgi:hypothetical protein